MTQVLQTKQIIFGNGLDSAEVYIDGEVGQTVNYTINGTSYSAILGSDGRETIQITCETPTMSIIVECEGQKAIIYSVGVG